MASKIHSSLKDFEPFFGGDQKGAFMVQAMFNGTNYTDRVGQNSGLMAELLRADNYKNYQNIRSTTGRAQNPDDVPQDIADLIITTALFHRAIDLSSTAGTNIGAVINKISTAANDWLKNYDWGNTASYTLAGTNKANNLPNIYVSVKNNADFLLYFMADRAAWDANNNFMFPTSLSTLTDDNNHTIQAAINEITTCPKANIGTACWGSVFTDANVKGEITKITNSGSESDRIIKRLQTALGISLNKIIIAMKQQMLDDYPSIKGVQGATSRPTTNKYGEFSANTVIGFMNSQNKNQYLQMLKNLINESIPKAMREAITTIFKIPHTTLAASPAAKEFFDAVYKAWPNMPSDIKEFYGQNVSIFARASSGLYNHANDQYRKQYLQMDWIRLTPNELDDLFARSVPLGPNELDDLRVNLMKSPASGYSEILFGTNLPDVPAGANVWYTHINGTFDLVPTPPTEFLRTLYSATYTSGVISGSNIRAGNYTLTNIESNIDHRPKQPFNLNIGKFTSAAIKREDEVMDSQFRMTQPSGPINADLSVYPLLTAYDMAYGKIWTFDVQKGQYYRMDETGRKVYYDDNAKGDTNTCYATYLSKGNDANCMRVIQCIADGNSKSLNRCLDVIGDGDLWSVAADDVQKVGPDMVKLVLRKFGVKGYEETDSNGIKYKVPMTYEEWKSTIVPSFPPDVQTTILNNARLNTYLRGLIGVCRSNPNILNKGNPSIISRDTTPDYIRNLNMRKYKIPAGTTKTQYEFFSDMLRNATQPFDVNQNMFNPITSGSFSNVMFVNPYSTMMPSMMGGNFYSANIPSLITKGTSFDGLDRQSQILKNGSASMFANFLTTIKNASLDIGLQLHPEDQSRIAAAINQLESYENQLARLCLVLVTMVKLARFYGITLENVDRDHPTTMLKLSEVQTMDDIRDFIRNHARTLTKNMATNMSIQQAAAYELMNKVGPRLIDECIGRPQNVSGTVAAPNRQLVNI